MHIIQKRADSYKVIRGVTTIKIDTRENKLLFYVNRVWMEIPLDTVDRIVERVG